MFDGYENKYDFSSVITDNTKHGYKFDSEYYERTGEIAIVDQSQKYICGYKKLENNKSPWDKECVIFGDHTEIFKYINFPFYLGADGAKILSVSNEWNTIFVYYYLLLNYQKVGNYSRHFKYLKEMKFPKPDMKLQIKFSDLAKQIDKSKFIFYSKNFL